MINFQKKCKHLNIIKWFVVGILTILTLSNHYYYINLSFPWHIITTIFLFISTISIAFLTKQGKKILLLIYEAKKETKKIIFPKLKETFHTTIIVIIATFIISLILWGLDNILIRFISFITTLRI
ncbi:MAG: preprotein translocase subunit SecE [Buchnera aphidicola (Nurudea ibofushi)]